MATAVGLSLNTTFLKRLEEAERLFQNLIDKNNLLSSTTVKAFQTMTQKGVVPYVESLRAQKAVLEDVAKVRLGRGATQEMKDMKKGAQDAVKEVNKLIKAFEKTSVYKGEMSGYSSMKFAKNILSPGGDKSVANMRLAISQLEAAQNRLNLNTKTGQRHYEQIGRTITRVKDELNKATGASKELTRESEKTKKTINGLGGVISTAFATTAIRGFLNNLIKVRGEFELQHKSLQVLLQDIDEANALWDKTIALAVKSPYRVKELVTYTKQLAAYRVESEKLYDTTRMLTDVSAGLGVDMNRLILAFGQVKAANFLRGTELRQFSEAGVNMLEELSKRFTQLEGRAVSIGDVFERVSKRMVKFSDVEAVFQTITSEGGVFYQMQEKQSETLRGMIMNLKDSVDLMFNEMGKASDSPLKNAIHLVRELVENWRKLIPVISGAGAAFLAAFSIKIIASIGTAFTALWGIIAANPIGAAITLVTALVVGIVSAKNKVNELTAAMVEVDRDVSKQLEDSIALYRKLAEQVRDVTATEKDRSKAMEQLKTKFGEILPDQLLELEYIKSIADNYGEATDAMMNYYNSKAMEQKRDRIESQFGEDIDTEVVDLIGGTRRMIENWSKNGLITEREKVALLSGVGGIIRGVSEGIKAGEVDDNFDSVRKAILKKLSEYAGVDSTWEKYISGGGSMLFEKNISEMIRQITNYREAIEGIEGLPTSTYAEKEAGDIFLPEKENVKTIKNSFQEIINLVDEYSKKALNEWTGLDEEFNALITKLPKEVASYIPLLSSMFENMKVAAAQGSFEFGKSIQGFQQEFLQELAGAVWSETSPSMASFIQDANGQWVVDIQNELVQLVTNAGETLRDEAERLNLNDFQKSVVGAMEVIAQKTGQSVNKFREFIPKMGDSLSSVRENVESEISLIESRITTWTNSMKVEAPELISNRPGALSETQSAIDALTKLLEAFKMLRNFLGGADKKKDRTDNTIEERIKVVDQMNKKYLELNKTLSKTESLQGAFDAYKDAFATAYGREDVRTMKVEDFVNNVLNFPNEDAIVEWFDKLETTVAKKEDKIKVQLAKGKFVMDIDVRAKKEKDQELFKDIQNMFDQYDLSLELKKLNIAPDVAKSLFGIESIGLEDIRKKVKDEIDKAKEAGGNKDRIKQLEKDLEKINDMEDKAQIERLQKYLKYTREAIGERAQIKVEEMTKLQEIEETFNKAIAKAKTKEDKKRIEEQRGLAISGVQREASQSLSKIDWEEFRKSETFISLFDDLGGASDAILTKVIEDLDKFKKEWKDLPLDQMKEVIELRNKAQRAMESNDSPWGEAKRLRGLIEDDGRTREEAELDSYNAEQEKARLEKELEMIGLINQKRAEGASDDQLKIVLGEKYGYLLGENVDLVTREGDLTNKLIPAQDSIIDKSQERIQNEKDLIEAYKKQEETLREVQKMANDLYDSFKELSEALGADSESPATIFADMGMSMANSVLNAIMLSAQLKTIETGAMAAGTALNTAMGVIGWIVMGVQLLTAGIKAIVKINDNKIVSQLEDQAAIIEKQRDLYEQIEEKVDKAYSVSQLRQYNSELERSVKLEIEALRASIALEKSRKKADEGQISDWEKEMAEARKRLAETKQEMTEEMGGIFDISDFTSGFVDAWWDAMDEGMSGLDALGEHFEETMRDMVKKQALYQGASAIMKQVQDVINKSLEGDYSIDRGEWDAILAAAKKANIDLDAFLQGYYDMFGSLSDGASGGLSALQKGIQGVTEDTAQIIEAYLNSIRGYVSEQVTHTRNIYRILNDAVHSDAAAIRVRMV